MSDDRMGIAVMLNIWNLLKNWLQAHPPHSSTMEKMKQAVSEGWDKITAGKIQQYGDAMPDQILKIVNNLEIHTQ